MNGWLLDTNVLSAFAPGRPALNVQTRNWFEDRTDSLFLSAITIAEIVARIAKLHRTGAARRADALTAWFERILLLYADRVLALDLAAARVAGELGDAAEAIGRHPGFAYIAVAAIAKSHDLVVLTMNRRHFDPLGVEVLNPFEAA
jgi:hypothetical protein